MDFTITKLQQVINTLQLGDEDEMYNVRMPVSTCEVCGGHGIKDWDGEDSVLCECILSTDNKRDMMPFIILRALNNLKKRQVYDE